MLHKIFYHHGHACASHPVEVIVFSVTLTLCLFSFGLFSHTDKICGWNYDCSEDKTFNPSGSDIIIFSIIKCSAVIYTYLQFRNLRRRGTNYMIGLSGFLSVLPSFIFSIVIIKIFGNDISGVKDVLPFFLLLIDLSKACELANYALPSRNQKEVQSNIAKGVSLIGPSMTLDSVAEILVIGVGTLSDVPHLETTCYYGCLSVFANYLVFMILYPACLALFLEVARRQGSSLALRQFQRIAKLVREEEKDQHPNPVAQNVKMIMSAGLLIVHVYSRLIAAKKSGLGEILAGHTIVNQQYREPDISLWHFYLQRFFTVQADSTFTAVLAIFLVTKYLFYDEDSTVKEGFCQQDMLQESGCNLEKRKPSLVAFDTRQDVVDSEGLDGNTSNSGMLHVPCDTKTMFTIGEDSEEEELYKHTGVSVCTQTEDTSSQYPLLERLPSSTEPRTIDDCVQILNSEEGPESLTDEEIINLVHAKHIPQYKLENILGDYIRSVDIRRKILVSKLKSSSSLDCLPFENYKNYDLVNGACCENVVGYIPVPVGVAGPLLLDGQIYHVPLATTEGCLVASTNRGCRALQQSGGVTSVVVGDGMSRAPVVRLPSAKKASEVKAWLEIPENFQKVKKEFDDTSRFARINFLHVAQAGRLLYIRFVAKTGDAMGMNMLSKGSERALKSIREEFPDLDILSLSGNFCTDKKPAAINWIEGRGKSVVCEALIPANVVKNVLKTTVSSMVELNINKNMVGSALAGSIGGFNAHAANLVTAVFVATGQDPAQNVTSCNCMTIMERTAEGDLYVSCTMPSIEVGTVGGGTILPPQAACLKMLGIQGSSEGPAGDNARCLARIVCATVLAGELSLMGALAAGHLVRSHMKHNRSNINMDSSKSVAESSKSELTLETRQFSEEMTNSPKTQKQFCDENSEDRFLVSESSFVIRDGQSLSQKSVYSSHSSCKS